MDQGEDAEFTRRRTSWSVVRRHRLFDSGLPARLLDALCFADFIALGFICLGVVCAPLIFLPLDTRSRRTAFLSNAAFAIPLIAGLVFAVSMWTRSETAGAALLSAVLATLGWAITQRNSKRQARKQHTITVLLQQRNSEMLQFHSINVTTYLRFSKQLEPDQLMELEKLRRAWTPTSASDKAGLPVLSSIAWILNYYEFISLGITSGDLNDNLMKRSIRGMLCDTYLRFYPVVAQSLQRADSGPHPFQNLKAIFEEWATPDEKRRLRNRERDWRVAKFIGLKPNKPAIPTAPVGQPQPSAG